ncbi:hepatitis A virus cellular receptor 1 homolog [Amia ocellicauda]|uniref:hepatitis A virus cellular receptor 1 homolog n=1 Tax=Amia ocellicauda TaxID=2972642 RepID=UPI003463CDA4
MNLVCLVSCCITSALMSVSGVSAVSVSGVVGENITLPCSYSVKNYGVLDVCWVRGEIPSMGCANTIISTKGNAVNHRASDRYQLWAGLTEGDVSLTILSAQERDSGTYGCRVEIPGPFNDQKHHFHLTVTQGGVGTTTAAAPDTQTTSGTDSPNRTDVFTEGKVTVNREAESVPSSTESSDLQKTHTFNGNLLRISAIVLVTALFLTLIMGLTFCKQKKTKAQSSGRDLELSMGGNWPNAYMETPVRALRTATVWHVPDFHSQQTGLHYSRTACGAPAQQLTAEWKVKAGGPPPGSYILNLR